MILPTYDENGRMVHNGARYNEIKRLAKMLDAHGVDYEMHVMSDGYQICVPSEHKPNKFDGDVIQHFGSYGAENDLLEVYGFGLDAPDGFLTAEEALPYFLNWAKEADVLCK